MRYEPASAEARLTDRHAVVIFEMNQWIHSLPHSIKSINALVGFIFNAYINPTINRIIKLNSDPQPPAFIFVADNYLLVPPQKAAVQRERLSRAAAAVAHDQSVYSDISDHAFPPIPAIHASPVLFYKAILLIAHAIQKNFATRNDCHVYISCPSPKYPDPSIPVDPLGCAGNIRITRDGPPAPPPWQFLGEGELVAHLWVDYMRIFYPLPRSFTIVSVDNDNYPIVLANSLTHASNLFIQLRSTTNPLALKKRKQDQQYVLHRRFLDCHALYSSIAPDAIKNPSFSYVQFFQF